MDDGAPLLCWDIFMYGYRRRMQMLDSLQRLNKLAKAHDWKIDWDIEHELLREDKIILVTDLAQVIRFASYNLKDMNGYTPAEVIGKSPKIFQGEGTADVTRAEIRQAIIRRIPFSGNITNYRKDGSPYQCIVEEYPVWNKEGALVNFIAFERVA